MVSPRDGRLMFAVPDGASTYAGTTDTPYSGDLDRVVAEAPDVRYILEAVNATFPGRRIAEGDVISTWAGLRPLIGRGARNTYETSREHAVWEDAPGLLTIAGGKLTTYRAMACDLLRMAEPRLRAAGVRPQKVGDTARTRLGGAPERRAFSAGEERAPDWDEVDRIVEEEMALTLSDVLIRRTHLFYEAPDQGLSVAEAVAARIGPALNWDAAERRRQVAQYESEVASNRAWRG
jgi:glycerol-3-phosphate dehydrogenase